MVDVVPVAATTLSNLQTWFAKHAVVKSTKTRTLDLVRVRLQSVVHTLGRDKTRAKGAQANQAETTDSR